MSSGHSWPHCLDRHIVYIVMSAFAIAFALETKPIYRFGNDELCPGFRPVRYLPAVAITHNTLCTATVQPQLHRRRVTKDLHSS